MPDRRNAKTDAAIFEAINQLVENKPLDSLTVTEVARTADITRKTFYDHFPSVESAFQASLDQIVQTLVAKTDIDWEMFLESDNDWTPSLAAKTRLNLFLGNIREYLEPQLSSSRMRNRHISLEEEVRYLRDPFKRAIMGGLLGEGFIDEKEGDLVSEFVLTGILWMYRRIILDFDDVGFYYAQERVCNLIIYGLNGA